MGRVAPKYPHYPLIFNIIAILQIIASGIVVVFFYVAWANISETPALKDALSLVEKSSSSPDEIHAPWYWKLLHGVGHLSLITTIFTFILNRFGKLYPPIGLVLNFINLFLYIAGVAGVAAFSFALSLVGKCDSGIGCMSYKIGFFTAHAAGLFAWALMLLDAYAWGQLKVHNMGYREFGKEKGGPRAMHLEPNRMSV